MYNNLNICNISEEADKSIMEFSTYNFYQICSSLQYMEPRIVIRKDKNKFSLAQKPHETHNVFVEYWNIQDQAQS